MAARSVSGVSRAEILTTLSLATDLGLGQPMEHVMRSSALALRLAERMGVGEEERAITFHAGLIAWIGCSADAYELARWFGDDISFRADSYDTDLAGAATALFLLRHLGSGGSFADRIRATASFLRDGVRDFDPMQTHCEVASTFALRLGLDEPVRVAIMQAFERWDGKGEPRGAQGGPDLQADETGPACGDRRGPSPCGRDERRALRGSKASRRPIRPGSGRRAHQRLARDL